MKFYREAKAPQAASHPARECETPDPIRISRTLVKSEPELRELISSEPRLHGDAVEVSLSEKGFGTRVAITARPGSELALKDIEAILDALALPQKRPFSAG